MESLKIQQFTLGKLKTNSYVITDEKSFCIIIDPGENPYELIRYIGKRKVDYILLTHSHYDHIAGLNLLKDYTDASVIVHHSEAEWLLNPDLNHSVQMNTPIVCEWPDILLNGDELIQCGSVCIKAIHTPGHSPGSTCYLLDNDYLFTGDTLLAGIVGPTNLPYGDRELIKESIKTRLYSLPSNIIIYPGHGETTTLEFEKTYNLLPNIKAYF
ncbi:beta-lactamase [Neobacillus bataviensis LMG 21833]|uniref:Beta-lactamase n=1 Tax=Neobacillus bataviensis LMG 21833 TaxID=1117379 RepID=K6DRP6_9BACI|nr:MBL fold metallo-hydrolase [Neobacillus bataviensis]EKN70984.1 beta-lactamase [Neobacillus bataviensis LMG 21833]